MARSWKDDTTRSRKHIDLGIHQLGTVEAIANKKKTSRDPLGLAYLMQLKNIHRLYLHNRASDAVYTLAV